MTGYYDLRIKVERHLMLTARSNRCTAREFRLIEADRLMEDVRSVQPDVIVHLAAQAGVRYSLENPRAYIDTNIVGTFNIMECARELGIVHLLMASTSSVYGANEEMPFRSEEHTSELQSLMRISSAVFCLKKKTKCNFQYN